MNVTKTKKKRRYGNGPAAIIISVLMVALAASGLYFGIIRNFNDGNVSPTSILRSDIVKTSIISSDGEEHSLEARFAVELTNEMIDSVDEKALIANITAALTSLNYDAASSYDGINYVKEMINKNLESVDGVNIDAIEGIYITDFLTDFQLNTDTLPADKGNSSIWKSLFKKIN